MTLFLVFNHQPHFPNQNKTEPKTAFATAERLRDGQRERLTAESSTLITAVDFDSLRRTNGDALRRLRLMAHKVDRR